MKKIIYPLVILLIGSINLTGCASGAEDDISDWMSSETLKLKGKIDPLPEVETFSPPEFKPGVLASPFAPPKKIEQSSNAPDQNRKKEFLEEFGLDTLSMVGIIKKRNITSALVKAPDGNVHVLIKGNYLGLNYGKIIDISESKIKLIEMIQTAGTGEWREMESTLEIKE